jgi:hypothetical protein
LHENKYVEVPIGHSRPVVVSLHARPTLPAGQLNLLALSGVIFNAAPSSA